jgi:peptidoglycan hydrolase CwlO-like protein
MNSLLLGTKALTMVSGLSTEILIQTVKTTSSGIIGTIKYISSHNNIDLTLLQKDLENIDLENKISIINQFIEEIENRKNVKESIKSSINSVHDMLDKINKELDLIKDDIQYHQTKYFNTWRSIYCDDKIDNIKSHNEILDKRFDLLMKLLSAKFD